jgi:hypothetical protein
VRLLLSALLGVLLSLGLVTPAGATARPIEDYASYDPPQRCHPKPRPGTERLAQWVAKQHGGGYVGLGRSCSRHEGPTSEHQAGRALDWSVDVRDRTDRRRAKALLKELFASDRRGNADALARRMGVMYVIWDDRMYPAWHGFEPEPYLNSGCPSLKRCSRTLRHRDHVHVSLSRDGAMGRTSWYVGRL